MNEIEVLKAWLNCPVKFGGNCTVDSEKDCSSFDVCWTRAKVKRAIELAISVLEKADRTTNAGRIRSMTDDELAQMLIQWQKTDLSTLWCKNEYGCADLDDSFDCTDELQASCIIRWLRQPKEESKCQK